MRAQITGEVGGSRTMRPVEETPDPSRPWPKAQVRLPVSRIGRPHVPAIDIHNHLGRWLSEDESFLGGTADELVAVMDDLGISTIVNLDGLWGEELRANLERFDRLLPDRVVTFCHLDWDLLKLGDESSPECVDALISNLADSAAAGARGVKVWKDLGLGRVDATGAMVRPDDARVVAVLTAAGDLGLPVLIHTADPVAFFEPFDVHNERYDELSYMPSWWFGGPEYPTFDELIDSLHTLVGACPGTTFIGAHVGGHAEDLDAVGAALTRLPNFNVDTGGRLAELGRQPRRFRRFVEEFPERVLFGTDCFPLDADAVRLWWRFFETADEHFDYGPWDEAPGQGNWRISAADLPTSLLPGLYRDNAQRILGL